MKNILVLEDNLEINDIIKNKLVALKTNVFQVYNAFDALKIFNEKSIDLIITDLMLPIKSGEDFIKEIRKLSNVYIIIISAKIDLENRLEGLSIGADDYLIKPFSSEELALKVMSYFKRKDRAYSSFSFNTQDLIYNADNNLLLVNNNEIVLTTVEFLLLSALITNANKILTRDQLLKLSYNDSYEVYDRVIDVHIKNIRKKIKEYSSTEYIKTVYGLGYKFEGEYDD